MLRGRNCPSCLRNYIAYERLRKTAGSQQEVPPVTVDINHLQQWIGKSESRADLITSAPMAALAATLDRDDPYPREGDALPLLWHWLYFLALYRQSDVAQDGHPKRGDFLPPVPLPRGMWAGDRLRFHRALRVGDEVTRTARIAGVSGKEGRTGQLVFVKVCYEISNSVGIVLSDDLDIVYREDPKPTDPVPNPLPARRDSAWEREIHPDEVLLFRYSALTFNSQRIHYDYPYATAVEGYPGLVVHGRLIATLLTDLLRRQLPEAAVRGFSFRAMRPLFVNSPFWVCGRPEADGKTIALWAKDAQGFLAMEATATLV